MQLPLSEQLRPRTFSEIVGQNGLVKMLSHFVESQRPLSLLLFGPPGSGKTTLARIYAASFQLPFVTLSAVLNSTTELKKILKEGHDTPLFHRQTVLFVDEIHRFNRAQQDIFLPFLEDGSLILIGATTENPSFTLNNALLSRLRIMTLSALQPLDLEQILARYEKRVKPLNLTDEGRQFLISLSSGDGRYLLNLIENLEQVPQEGAWDKEALAKVLQKRAPLYDRHQDQHYNLISALHKSVRGSDPDAALYWFTRMLEGGEDPLYIGRRLIRMATEDVGLADPQALGIALQGWNTYHMLGSPEGELALAQVVLYLALCPKSNAAYTAYGRARELAKETGHLNPPKSILTNYVYDHDTPHAFSGAQYFPDGVANHSFYQPVERGFEREMKKRLEWFVKLRLHQSDK